MKNEKDAKIMNTIEYLVDNGVISLDFVDGDDLRQMHLDEFIEEEVMLPIWEIDNFKQLLYYIEDTFDGLWYSNSDWHDYMTTNADQIIEKYGIKAMEGLIYLIDVNFTPEEFRKFRESGYDLPIGRLDLSYHELEDINNVKKILDVLRLEERGLEDFYDVYLNYDAEFIDENLEELLSLGFKPEWIRKGIKEWPGGNNDAEWFDERLAGATPKGGF